MNEIMMDTVTDIDMILDESNVEVLDIGVTKLDLVDRLIKDLVVKRERDEVTDTILLLSHEPVLTVGARQLNPDDLLRPLHEFKKDGIELVKTGRGGGLTYHWPGQLNCYPILKLRSEERNISDYMYKLEEIGLRTLKSFGIDAKRKRDKTAQIGLWHNDMKIASMGISVSRWVTSYGFALNLMGDLEPSRHIRPCGLKDVKLITMSSVLGYDPDREMVKREVLHNFANVFKRNLNFQGQIARENKVYGHESRISV